MSTSRLRCPNPGQRCPVFNRPSTILGQRLRPVLEQIHERLDQRRRPAPPQRADRHFRKSGNATTRAAGEEGHARNLQPRCRGRTRWPHTSWISSSELTSMLGNQSTPRLARADCKFFEMTSAAGMQMSGSLMGSCSHNCSASVILARLRHQQHHRQLHQHQRLDTRRRAASR